MTKRRLFSREFKAEAVRLAYERGRKSGEVARELGLRTDMLERWRLQFQGLPSGSSEAPSDAEQELRRTKRELDRVRLERDILKKALAIFADPSA